MGYVAGARYTIRWITKCPDDLIGRMFQVEGLPDNAKLDQAVCKRVENFCYLTQQATELREIQVMVNFDGFLRDQQGKFPEDASWALIRAAEKMKDAVEAKGIEIHPYNERSLEHAPAA